MSPGMAMSVIELEDSWAEEEDESAVRLKELESEVFNPTNSIKTKETNASLTHHVRTSLTSPDINCV